MNYQVSLALMAFLLPGITRCAAGENVSRLWTDYENARLSGNEPELADFSYAGYHTGVVQLPEPDWTVFDVTEFGAVPDDGKSDKEALIKAIRAAEKNGSGIILFPKGRFRVNDESDPHNEPILIRGSNIVLRGSGSGQGGTELFFERHMDPQDPKKLWTCPYAIQIKGKGKTKVSSAVVKDSRRETFSAVVADASGFKAGDWVLLACIDKSPESVASAVAPHPVDPRWKELIEGGVDLQEIHRVASIEGNRLTFMEPIHANVAAEKDWSVRKLNLLEEVGIEDIAFVGNWKDDFVHHKDAIHDGGWSCLSLDYCANSWIRDCRFTNLNRAVATHRSAALTIQDILLDGNPGHNAISILWTTHALVQRVTDKARHWHASGVAKPSAGNVFLRSEYSSDTCHESHASQPRWTLMDNISGGWKYGRWGGALANQPNHLEGLIFWNYRNTGDGEPGRFHFMRPDSDYGRIIQPYVIGFHGNPQEWDEDQIEVLESNGQPVFPQSLYEAQLELRLRLEKMK